MPLEITLDDGAEDVFPLAYVVDAAGATVAGSPFTLVHHSNGTYRNAALSMPDQQFVRATFVVFSDAAHLVDDTDNHSRDGITFFRDESATGAALATAQDSLDALAASLALALGLAGNHKFVDNTTFDASNQMLTCRVRVFSSAAAAAAATDGGAEAALATFTVTATYEALGKMGTYRSVGP